MQEQFVFWNRQTKAEESKKDIPFSFHIYKPSYEVPFDVLHQCSISAQSFVGALYVLRNCNILCSFRKICFTLNAVALSFSQSSSIKVTFALSWDCFTTEMRVHFNAIKPSQKKEKKNRSIIKRSSDLWTVMSQSSQGNLVSRAWEDRAQFLPAAPATTEKAIKSIHQKASVSGAIHSEDGEEKYHQYLTLFYGEATWFYPMTPKMTTSYQLQSSKNVCISYFRGLVSVVIFFTHIWVISP